MMSEDASSGKGMKATTMSKPELLTVAGESLKSLIWQWFLCFSIWVAMLLITRGSPSPTEIGICCVVSFSGVAFAEFTNSSTKKSKITKPIPISKPFGLEKPGRLVETIGSQSSARRNYFLVEKLERPLQILGVLLGVLSILISLLLR